MESTTAKSGSSGVAACAVDNAALFTLDAQGLIHYCSQAAASLFKYRRSELLGRHVSVLLPQLAELELVQNGELNSRLRFLFHTGRHFAAITKDAQSFCGDIFLNKLDDTGAGRLSLIVNRAEGAVNTF